MKDQKIQFLLQISSTLKTMIQIWIKYLPYKRDFLILNKAVINYLPRSSIISTSIHLSLYRGFNQGPSDPDANNMTMCRRAFDGKLCVWLSGLNY